MHGFCQVLHLSWTKPLHNACISQNPWVCRGTSSIFKTFLATPPFAETHCFKRKDSKARGLRKFFRCCNNCSAKIKVRWSIDERRGRADVRAFAKTIRVEMKGSRRRTAIVTYRQLCGAYPLSTRESILEFEKAGERWTDITGYQVRLCFPVFIPSAQTHETTWPHFKPGGAAG